MKTIFSKTKIMALAFAAIFSTTAGYANNSGNEHSKPEEVRFVGNVNDLPVYRLTLKNKESATYLISIKNDEGHVLFSEKISGTELVRNYELDEAPTHDYSLTFEVNNISAGKRTVYSVNKTQKAFDEIAINEVK